MYIRRGRVGKFEIAGRSSMWCSIMLSSFPFPHAKLLLSMGEVDEKGDFLTVNMRESEVPRDQNFGHITIHIRQ
jgi:hypothetical protein